jgi:ubiquinol-cytochrome c reductase cytochrome b subunit
MPPSRWPASLPSTGSLALGCLPVVLISGSLLAIHFDPAAPRASVEAIEEVVPFGFLVRGLHYFGGHLFLSFTLAHTAARLRARDYRRVSPAAWATAVLAVPLVIWVMLSGFLLRGDPEAVGAAEVAHHLLGLLPDGGHTRACLLGTTPAALYLQHAATATVVLLVLILAHARIAWPSANAVALPTTAVLCLAAIISAPIIPQGTNPVHAPWYLLGLQEALHRTPHPAWPFLPPLALGAWLLALPRVTDRWLATALTLVVAPYVVLSFLGWMR